MSGAEHSYLYARAHRQLWDFFDAFLSAFKVTDFERGRILRRLVMLTPREREVLILVCRGFTQPEVAGELGIGVETARMHVRKVYWKLGLRRSRHIAPLMLRVLVSLREG